MASTSPSIESLLSSLTASLDATRKALPDESLVSPKSDGISLLDTKTEIFLSYLQNLSFLLFLKLQEFSLYAEAEEESLPVRPAPSVPLVDKVVEKLAELRLYMDKGIGPIENKLKYQITQILNIADNVQRLAAQTSAREAAKGLNDGDSENDDSDSESSSDEEITYAPNISTMKSAQSGSTTTATGSRRETDSSKDDKSGIYRPPRIAPTSLNDLPKYGKKPDEETARDGRKSRTLDEFVSTEMATAPSALPSVGSNIASMGRRIKSTKERQDESERLAYEESNMVRLAKKPNKKDKIAGQRARASQYGGEDWRDLNAGIDRIARLTSKASGRSRATETLERSRKRGHGEDGGDSYREGDAFKQKRKKFMRSRGRDV